MSRAPEITAEAFFEKALPHSIAKAEIVSDYVIGWAKIIINGRKSINRNPLKKRRVEERAYFVDLFCGCGVYKDGYESTPIKVVKEALQEPSLVDNLIIRFNDAEKTIISRLEENINNIQNVNFFNKIKYTSYDAESQTVLDWFQNNARGLKLPMLVFIDPFGYKQISQDLLRIIINIPQSDIIFFFNYKRVNAALDNGTPGFETNMDKLFGSARVQRIKSEFASSKPSNREVIILRHLEEALKEVGANFVCPYLVVPEDENQTSHYIVCMSKHEKGYELMKKVMRQHSVIGRSARARFGHDPASLERDKQQSLFDILPDPIAELAQELVRSFTGLTITFGELYKLHHPTSSYTPSEYKSAVRLLLAQNSVFPTVDTPTKVKQGQLTIPDHFGIRFK